MHRKLVFESLETRCLLDGDVGQWERWEVAISNADWQGNPFDMELTGEFTHTASGRTLTQFGFYAGANTWKIYFMPDAVGQWTYTTHSPDADLDGQTGNFTAIASALDGMLIADGNRWKLSDGDHELPVIWTVTDVPAFRVGAADDPLVLQELDQAGEVAGARLMESYELVRNDWIQEAHPYVDGQEGEMFNLDFWDRLNDKLDSARDRGIGMYHMFFSDDSQEPNLLGIGADSAEEARLFRYAIARLAPYPIVMWDSGIDISEYRSSSWVDSFVDYFHQNDPWQHPVSSRDSPGPVSASETYRSQGGAGDGGNDSPSREELENLLSTSSIPIVHTDHYRVGFDRGNWDNDAIRRVMWRLGLSGHQGVLIDYFRGSPSQSVIDEGAAYVGHATKLFNESLVGGLDELDPHDELLSDVSHGAVGSDVILAADRGQEYVVYAKLGGSFALDLVDAGSLVARWYNPRTGAFSGSFSANGGGTVEFTAPTNGTNQDWVLHLYADPGGTGDETPPSTPGNLTATPQSSSDVQLTWSAASDPDSGILRYHIYRDNEKIGESTNTSFRDTGLQPSTIYSYQVSAVNGDGLEGSRSSAVNIATGPHVGPDGRVIDGLVVLYDLEEGGGSTVFDSSGVGASLNLTIANPASVTWVDGGLSIDASTIIASAQAATKIIDAVAASNEITVEAWVRPESAGLDGPARIVTLSPDTSVRNFTLGQELASYDFRLRTTATSAQGTPSTQTGTEIQAMELTHVVFTRNAAGSTAIYVDGIAEANSDTDGNFSNWDSGYRFALANELTLDRGWLGDIHLVAVYDRALTFDEVQQNRLAGADPNGSATVGDYNQNGIVDAADYTVWRDTLGSTTDLRANGDDSNSLIDQGDYDVWVAHFGETHGLTSAPIAGDSQSLVSVLPSDSAMDLIVGSASGKRISLASASRLDDSLRATSINEDARMLALLELLDSVATEESDSCSVSWSAKSRPGEEANREAAFAGLLFADWRGVDSGLD